jgi:hypothetical protein
MSDEDFLSRWSRRKQAATGDAKKAKDETPVPAATEPEQKKTEDDFDPSTLPPIDSISAISDVRDFLRAGVPAELTRAALRRAWSADPAIRDFIGLAENSWDFTAPDAIPGFGPLNASPEDIRQLVDRIMSHTGDLADASAADTSEPPESIAKSPPQPEVRPASDPQKLASEAAAPAADLPAPVADQRKVDVAMQQDSSDDEGDRLRPRRSRGAALPR